VQEEGKKGRDWGGKKMGGGFQRKKASGKAYHPGLGLQKGAGKGWEEEKKKN